MNDKEIAIKTQQRLFIGELENYLRVLNEEVFEARKSVNRALDKIAYLQGWITKEEIKRLELMKAESEGRE